MRVFLSCPSTIAPARQRPNECRICRSPSPVRHLAITNSQRGGQRPYRSEEQVSGEEAATPRQPVALSRVLDVFPFGNSLSLITAATGSAESSSKLRNSHVSLNTLSPRMSRPATQKPASLVKKLWTT